jgi:hypothetical protein
MNRWLKALSPAVFRRFAAIPVPVASRELPRTLPRSAGPFGICSKYAIIGGKFERLSDDRASFLPNVF